ncbi:hypothetical protein CTI12_AA456670 [Artemisia annua]|uniref:Reverse transcriptase RNase H-like domain-containing protein n=1 Tax=Artemisia annua TaxID=35608 RepID=A0A2U1LTA8_ARTAN|nr:hypothetical protein CTI12_AA456670 [Artemisia annua]
MLFAEKRNVQIPIYFVSKALPEVERSYAESEKPVLAVVYATRYLRRYFKDHPIRVLTDKPIEWTFLKPDRSRRMETNMSSNKKTLEAKREEKHQVGDLKMHKTSHSQKKGERLVEPSFE